MLDKLLNFMDLACIDPRMYWRIPSLDGSQQFEIQWRRDDKHRWRFRKLGEILWELCSDHTLIRQLSERGIDMAFFESNVKRDILQQVAYADRIIREARQLMSAEVVEQAIEDHRSFLATLEAAISQLTRLPLANKPKLRIIREDEDILLH